MRVAGFVSGSGTNIRRLLEHERALGEWAEGGSAPFEVVFLFSDRSDGGSKGEAIARDFGIPYFSYDIRMFHVKHHLPRTVRTEMGLQARVAFDRIPSLLVQAFGVDVVALGGYMSYTTLARCVNVHPADLSLFGTDGRRRYTGDQAVRDAILAGEPELRASTLWTDEGVDTGPLLMVSEPLPVRLPLPLPGLAGDPDLLARVCEEHQEALKRIGDWKIFPKTIQRIAEGRFSMDAKGGVYFDGRPVPSGLREGEAGAGASLEESA